MHALDGIRVVDFTTMWNGPYATLLLSDMGADVLKVEPPDGDPWRRSIGGFLGCNRGKRSISLDLKKTQAKEIVHQLIADADIVVENARWGVWHKMGLDYDAVKKIKPDIIYLSALGYGSTGPLASRPAFDPVMQCRSGQMANQGGFGEPPVYHAIAINDCAGPMLGAYGVVLALLVRARTGKGQHIETSLTNAAAVMQAGKFIDYPGMAHTSAGKPDMKGLSATWRLYQAGDGRWLMVLCATEEHWRKLCQTLDRTALLADPLFETKEKRAENDGALEEILAAAFRGKPAGEWIAALQEARVPAALSQTYLEVLGDPHVLANDLFDCKSHRQFGETRAVGVTPRFSEMTGVIARPTPLLGEHTREVLSGLGYSEGQIAELEATNVAFQAKL
jgi:crotonobetainyl-CoA:carnitine CoA-transferase CaiB-like acyl-CoA transferase